MQIVLVVIKRVLTVLAAINAVVLVEQNVAALVAIKRVQIQLVEQRAVQPVPVVMRAVVLVDQNVAVLVDIILVQPALVAINAVVLVAMKHVPTLIAVIRRVNMLIAVGMHV